MGATLRKSFRLLVFLLFANVIILLNGVGSSEASVNGILRQVGNQQILNLWGTNYEMGYAHGYLMADKIRDLVDHYMVGLLAAGNVAVYNDLLAKAANPDIYQWRQQSLDEINGMADGMAASGKNLYVSSLGRNIDSRDIRAFNLQEEFYYFGCSSFGVWGNATATGETILARNFDFFYDNQGNFANYQIIIAYEPTGMAKFVSFAWPGMFGVYSGMNESGVSMLDNTGNGTNPYGGPYHPVLEIFRNILENSTPTNYLTQPLSIVNSVYEFPPEIIQIGTPYRSSGDPVYYIEESPDQNAIRYPTDTDPGYNHIIATNHFMNVLPPPSYGNSIDRYNTIRNGLINLYGGGDGKVDSTEAWGLLSSVANIRAPTLTSIIIRPNRMEFDLSFAKVVNGTFTTATDIQPQTYTWTSLFPNHELPDLIVQSITVNPASPELGQPVAVTITVKNQGGTDAGSFYIDNYQNLTATPASRQVGDANCLKNSLAAGATDSCTFTVKFSAAGSYKMWAQVDTEQQVVESDETNNVFGPQAIMVGSSALTLSTLSLNPTSVSGGATSQGTVTLSGSAPSGGVVVSLSDNSSAASVPASVTVPSGSSSATFTLSTTPVTSPTSVTIYAVYAGMTKTATLTVTPPVLSTISGTISPLPSGAGATVTLTQGATTVSTVTAANDGTFTFPLIANGSYTVTPNKSGFTFTPASAPVTVNGANVTGINFTASGLVIDATTSSDSGRAMAGTTIAAPTFTTKAGNELLLAFISASYIGAAPNINVTGVSGGGLTWTLVRRTNTQQGASEIWQAFAPVPLTNATVTASLSTSGAAASISVVAFAGVNVTTPVGAVSGGSAATGAPTASLTTQGANSWVFGVGNDWDGAVARTVGASQTMMHEYLSPTGDTFWVQRQNATVQPAGTVVTINDTAPTNHQWNLSIVEVRQ